MHVEQAIEESKRKMCPVSMMHYDGVCAKLNKLAISLASIEQDNLGTYWTFHGEGWVVIVKKPYSNDPGFYAAL